MIDEHECQKKYKVLLKCISDNPKKCEKNISLFKKCMKKVEEYGAKKLSPKRTFGALSGNH